MAIKPMVSIYWVDSVRAENAWVDDEVVQDFTKSNEMDCHTVGQLLATTDDRVVICHSHHLTGEFLGVIAIPRAAITKIVTLVESDDA